MIILKSRKENSMLWAIIFSVGTGAFGFWMGFNAGRKEGLALGESIGYNRAKSKYHMTLRKSVNHPVKPSVRGKAASVDTVWMG